MTDDIADGLRPKLVGARVLRVEDPRLLAGKGAYVDDHKIPGTLAVAFRRSDHAHARITGIDTSAAQAMPGVAAVVSAADLEGTFAPLRATSRMKNYHATDLLPLAHGKVRYVGEPVVAVIAENRYLAEDAARRSPSTTSPLPDLTDAERAAAGERGAASCGDRHKRTCGAGVRPRRCRCRGGRPRRCGSKPGSGFAGKRRWRSKTAPTSPTMTTGGAR